METKGSFKLTDCNRTNIEFYKKNNGKMTETIGFFKMCTGIKDQYMARLVKREALARDFATALIQEKPHFFGVPETFSPEAAAVLTEMRTELMARQMLRFHAEAPPL